MSYNIFTGKQRSLVFPVMCNAFATIDYSNNIVDSADDIPYGIWAHTGDFTFEAVITPYDINGYGAKTLYNHHLIDDGGNLTKVTIGSEQSVDTNSEKIMPALGENIYTLSREDEYYSELYLNRADKLNHEMRIFHSSNFQISLLNSTTTLDNQPSQYKIKVGLKVGTGSMEYFISDVVISPNQFSQFKYSTAHGYNYGTPQENISGINDKGQLGYKIYAKATAGSSGTTVNVDESQHFFAGKEIFIKSGDDFISLGTINNVSSNTSIVLDTASPYTISNGDFIYSKEQLEPLYINNMYHISCAYTDEDKALNIFFNGKLVLSGEHTAEYDQTFSFPAENYYIGANGTGAVGANTATSNNQFMGELHELCISKTANNSFSGLNNLLPSYNDALIYLRFEEIDE